MDGELKPTEPSLLAGRLSFALAPPLPTLARVPEVRLTRDQQRIGGSSLPPRWMKPLLPIRFQRLIDPRGIGSAGPIPEIVPLETDEILNADELPDPRTYLATEGRNPAVEPATYADGAPVPPTPLRQVVVLPPKVSASARRSEQLLADAVSDHLAAALETAKIARVVDRDELDRVLRERNLSTAPAGPVLAYDLLMRLDIDADRLAPRARLTLVELSTGTAVGDVSAPWPARKTDLQRWVAACREAVAIDAKTDRRIVKVRLTPPRNVTRSARMAPFARRLTANLRDSLGNAPEVRIVEHLEAATAKEESLLLLMGHSRLADERRFEPESDYSIELRIEEQAAVGKTFDDTPITLGVRVRRRSEEESEWRTFTGRVKEFDKLAAEVWSETLRRVTQSPPRKIDDVQGELAERRRQAEIEVEAAGRANSPAVAVQHAAAAVKLDPASVEIHYAYLQALKEEAYAARKSEGNLSRSRRLLAEVRVYLERFGPGAPSIEELPGFLRSVNMSPPLLEMHRGDVALAVDGDLAALLDDMKFVLDAALKRELGDVFPEVVIVYRGMRSRGRPIEGRDAWVDGLLAEAERHSRKLLGKKNADLRSFEIRSFGGKHVQLVIAAATLALEEGRSQRARELANTARNLLAKHGFREEAENDPLQEYYFQSTRRLFQFFDDPDDLAEFDRAFGLQPTKIPARGLSVRLESPARYLALEKPEAPRIDVHYNRPDSGPLLPSDIWPLAVTKDRLYVLLHVVPTPVFAYVPLNADGSPKGKEVVVPGRKFGRAWDAITRLPAAPLRSEKPVSPGKDELRITGARMVGNRLYVGTTVHGLLVFDPAEETWSVFGPEQGLPSWSVDSFFPLDDDTLYCTALVAGEKPFSADEAHYTLGLTDGKVTLIHRSAANGKRFYDFRLEGIWKNVEKWSGWSGSGALPDLFHGLPHRGDDADEDAFRNRHSRRDDRLRFVSLVAEVGPRRFVWWKEQIREIDADGRIIRSWRGWRTQFYSAAGEFAVQAGDESPFPSPTSLDLPLTVAGKYLVIGVIGGTTLFDPETETWYGPFEGNGKYSLGTEIGLWTFNQGVIYTRLDDLIAAAKASGNVWTLDRYHGWRRNFIETAETFTVARGGREFTVKTDAFQQAVYWIVAGEFQRARVALKKIEADDPNRADVLLLLGGLHEANHVEPHGEAESYFLRLAAHEDDQAAYTGLRRLIDFYRTHQRWPAAQARFEQMTARFEHESGPRTWEIDRIRKEISRGAAAGDRDR
ncbi:MAG: hypothetical protein WD069_22870 [Planctomycetales bacterium]